MFRLSHRLTQISILIGALFPHSPVAVAEAFSWYIDQSGEIVTLHDHQPASSPPETSQPGQTPPDASARAPIEGEPAPSTGATLMPSPPGLIASLVLGGSGYVFGKRLFRRLRKGESRRRSG